jgi:geranylgeranyl diphosphate synthase type I
MTTASAVQASLHRGRDAVVPALRAALERLDDTSRALSFYHLGWTDMDGAPAAAAGGKAVRPTLALLSAQAAGAPAEAGLPGAVAVELVHNFSLLHDDLMDGDTKRRHRPTVWAVWGAASAILTGDALLALAHEVLLESASGQAAAAARLLAGAIRELIRGQVLDVAFEQRADVTLAECLDMVAGKTGALLAASAAVGAVLAGAAPGVVAALSRYGAELGVAFQLVDDLLGIWGEPAVTGKPVYSDLRAGKKTLPVTYVVARGGTAGRELERWLAARATPGEPELRRAARLVEAGGGRAWAAAEAQRRVEQAAHALSTAAIPAATREELVAISRFVVAREA